MSESLRGRPEARASAGHGLGEPLLTIREVAEFLHLDEKTVRRWAAQGRIPCVRLGRALRFERGDVFRWVSARKES
jgi:excisionase family DNA binding protein